MLPLLRQPIPVVAVLGIACVLAGCAGQGAAADAAASAPPNVVAAPDSEASGGDVGAIEGIVVSDESAPVRRARVAIIAPVDLEAATDADGTFRFENLGAGDYTIFASAVGYMDASRRATVVAGESTAVRIVLESVPFYVPSTELFVDDFFWACAVSTLGTGQACYSYTGTMLQEKHLAAHASKAGLVGVVASVHWVANQYLGAKRTGVSAWDVGHKSFNTTVGFSPVTTRLLWDEAKSATDSITTWNYFGSYCTPTSPAGCASDPPHSVVQVVIEQRFKAYTTQFYVNAAPPDYVSAPP